MKSLLKVLIAICFICILISNSHADNELFNKLRSYDGQPPINKIMLYATLPIFQGKPFNSSDSLSTLDAPPATIEEVTSALWADSFSYSFEAFSALSFVETILALAFSGDVGLTDGDLLEFRTRFEKILKILRYGKENPPNYLLQNHFISIAWVPSNQWLLEDITQTIVRKPFTNLHGMNFRDWLTSHSMLQPFLDTLISHKTESLNLATLTSFDQFFSQQKKEFYTQLKQCIHQEFNIKPRIPKIIKSELTYIPIDRALTGVATLITKLPKACLLIPVTQDSESQLQKYGTNIGTRDISILTRSSHACYATSICKDLFNGVVTTCTLKEYLSAVYKTYPDIIGIHLQGFR